MMFGEAIIARLKVDPLNTAVGGRIYWLRRPQGDPLPAIVLQTITEDRPQHLKGFDDMRTCRLQVGCIADGPTGYQVSRELAEMVIAQLTPATEVVDPAGDDIIFWRAQPEGPVDLGEQTDTGYVHRAVVDMVMRYGTAA